MSIEQRPSCVLAQVTGTTGVLVQATAGVASCTRNSAGNYSLLLSPGVPLNKGLPMVQILGGAPNSNATLTSADGITWTIITSVAAVATDENFVFFFEPTAA